MGAQVLDEGVHDPVEALIVVEEVDPQRLAPAAFRRIPSLPTVQPASSRS